MKITVVKSGKRVEIDELNPDYSIPKGEPDLSKSEQDNLTVVELVEE